MLHFQDVREELELSGHNLTSVLNNPRETFMDSLYEAAFEAEPPLPDLEVVRANVPHGIREITPQDVEPYLRKTAALTKAYERNHLVALGQQDAPPGARGGGGANGPSARRASASDVVVPGVEEAPRYGLGLRRFRNGGSTGNADGGKEAATAAAAAAAASAANGGGANGGKAGSERDLGGRGSVSQCFEQVPSMFFDKEFTLQDPAVFESAVMAAGAEQPERLAHFLDLVEVCLLKQISHRSDAFFEGLKTSQDLQTHVTGACTTLYQLRESMRCMEKDVLAGPMRVPQLQRRRGNLSSLEATLELVARVQQSQAAIEGLLAAEDYLGALDILQSAKSTVKNELGKLHSLRNVGRQLKEYEELVSGLLSNRFVALAVTIPVDVVGSAAAGGAATGGNGNGRGDPADGLSSWETAAATDREGGDAATNGRGGEAGGAISAGGDEMRRDLELVVQGLLRLGEMERVLGVVQDRVSEDLKLIIRTVVGDFLATTDDAGELMDTFHLFGDESAATGAGTGPGTAAGAGSGNAGGGGEDGEQGTAAAAGGQSVAKLKTLDGEAFCSCLEMCFEHMHEGGGRGGEEGGGDVGDQLSSVVTSEEGSVIVERSRSCLRRDGRSLPSSASLLEKSFPPEEALSELMERSVSQLLSVRREHNCTKLDVDELKHLWDITVAFIQSVERLSGCNGYKLRSTLLSQAKAFVEARHEANKQTLVKRLDAEKWTQADVTPERQAVLDRLSSGQVFRPSVSAANANGTDGKEGSGAGGGSGYDNGGLRLPGDPPAQPNFVGGARSGGRKGGRAERRREAVVGGASFKAVGSALLVAEMSANFLQFADHFPTIGTDILTRLGELLRVFNSRATQLVLGAGAIHSTAKLKSISAKHLALCSQSLGLVRSLIPFLKAALSDEDCRRSTTSCWRRSGRRGARLDYRDHRDKILTKFVSMIEELIEARSGTLKLTDWDTPGGGRGAAVAAAGESSGDGGAAAGGGADPCQFTADVRKGVTAMHNILQQQLPPEQLQAVFRRMFAVITRKVPACFQREGVSPSTAAGRQRILDDVGFACAALSTLRGVDSSTLGLEQAIAEIYGKGIDGTGGGSPAAVAPATRGGANKGPLIGAGSGRS
ncbi:conserved unknown protein [Ectocarpus siliculosus]|uniref:Vacuolar protein sorting-associated protein 54 n=1 Tax=Ectocarpus siliculosus TaxID=2880 RepID=D7G0A0_ECTSI|nr:conserved unknown protein [Ectocarpus siliculosus]|eukprot:CBJ32982.1 conserved unknown protein [Ectocarpus siliculosus]